MDQTLVYTYDDEKVVEEGITSRAEYFDVRKRMYKLVLDDVMDKKKGKGEREEMWGIIRPYTKEFLRFCFGYFKTVAVWSAGREGYVDALVDILFKDVERPHVIFTYDDCEYTKKKILIKPIRSMIEKTDGLAKYMKMAAKEENVKAIQYLKNNIIVPPKKVK